MNEKSNAVLVALCPPEQPFSDDTEAHNRKLIDVMERAGSCLETCGDDALRLSKFLFLVDQDSCFGEIVKLIAYCNSNGVRLLISEVGESPVLLSPTHQAAKAFLEERRHRVRMTKRPTQAA